MCVQVKHVVSGTFPKNSRRLLAINMITLTKLLGPNMEKLKLPVTGIFVLRGTWLL